MGSPHLKVTTAFANEYLEVDEAVVGVAAQRVRIMCTKILSRCFLKQTLTVACAWAKAFVVAPMGKKRKEAKECKVEHALRGTVAVLKATEYAELAEQRRKAVASTERKRLHRRRLLRM